MEVYSHDNNNPFGSYESYYVSEFADKSSSVFEMISCGGYRCFLRNLATHDMNFPVRTRTKYVCNILTFPF